MCEYYFTILRKSTIPGNVLLGTVNVAGIRYQAFVNKKSSSRRIEFDKPTWPATWRVLNMSSEIKRCEMRLGYSIKSHWRLLSKIHFDFSRYHNALKI